MAKVVVMGYKVLRIYVNIHEEGFESLPEILKVLKVRR